MPGAETAAGRRGAQARLRRALPAWALVLAAGLPAAGANPGLVSGAHGASLGAGAATGAERAAWGRTPAALRPGTTGILLHVHRPFGMEELRVVEAAGYRDFRWMGLGAAWRQTGVEETYAEDAGEIQAAFRLGAAGRWPGTLDLGYAVTGERRAYAGLPSEAGAGHGFGAAWRILPGLSLGAFARGIPFAGSPWSEAAEGRRVVQAGLEARAGGGGGEEAWRQALRFDVRRTGRADWRTLASLAVRPQGGVEIAAGLASAPFQFSLGIRLAWRGLAVHQAFRHHRDLGSTWLSSFAWSSGPGET